MKLFRNAIVAAVLLLLVGVAAAQGGGGGQRRFGGMMNDPTGVLLLMRSDVTKELKITDDEKTKLDALRQKAMDDMKANMPQPSGGNFDREAMMKMFQKMQADMAVEVAKVLTKDQMTRLHEVNVQLAGNMAATWTDVQKELSVTDDQKAKIKDLQSKQQEANQGLGQKIQDGEMTREEVMDAFKKNNEVLSSEIGKVLTEPQRAKLKTMGGKEFKPDPDGGQ